MRAKILTLSVCYESERVWCTLYSGSTAVLMKGPYTCIDRLIANSPIPPSVPGRLARVTGTVAGGRALKQPAGCTDSGPNPSTSSRISTREQQSHARELSK